MELLVSSKLAHSKFRRIAIKRLAIILARCPSHMDPIFDTVLGNVIKQ